MKTSDALEQAWALINQAGTFSRRSPARNAEQEVVHALHPAAVCWDSVGAVQKVLGELEGQRFDNALKCLQLGAMKVSPLKVGGRGVIEINDNGAEGEIALMWSFAIQTAKNVELHIRRSAVPA